MPFPPDSVAQAGKGIRGPADRHIYQVFPACVISLRRILGEL